MWCSKDERIVRGVDWLDILTDRLAPEESSRLFSPRHLFWLFVFASSRLNSGSEGVPVC
jgi:hypothetical protein